jgi:hypothetical protein
MLRSRVIREYLVVWRGFLIEDAKMLPGKESRSYNAMIWSFLRTINLGKGGL